MKQDLIIGLGGFIGTVCRFRFGAWAAARLAPEGGFPAGTLLVNLSGCLIIGLLSGLAARQGVFTPEIRAMLITGFTGGYTTFSAFAAESTGLMRRGETPAALLYILLSVVLGCLLAWAGLRITAPPGTV